MFKGCISLGSVIHTAYNDLARWIVSPLALVVGMGIVITQIFAVTNILTYLLSISNTMASIIAFAMITCFSLMGGVRTITQTGVFNSVCFLLLPLSYTIISYKYGWNQQFK